MHDDNEHLQHIRGMMLSNAALLKVRIAGATSGGLYDFKMEAAIIIRRAAHDLMVQKHALEISGFEYVEHYDIVQKLLEEYRFLFIDRVP